MSKQVTRNTIKSEARARKRKSERKLRHAARAWGSEMTSANGRNCCGLRLKNTARYVDVSGRTALQHTPFGIFKKLLPATRLTEAAAGDSGAPTGGRLSGDAVAKILFVIKVILSARWQRAIDNEGNASPEMVVEVQP
jgi:hypothetical protein